MSVSEQLIMDRYRDLHVLYLRRSLWRESKMGDELKEIARMYGELFGKAASGNFYTHIVPKDLYRSLQVIAERLLALEKVVAERCVQIDDDVQDDG